MAYSIRLPDGTLVQNIPDELSPEEAKQRIIKAYPQFAPKEGVLRQAADIPVQIGKGAVAGIRMIADAFGADNPASSALRGAEDYLSDLLSAQAKRDQQEMAKILKDAEDKGVLDQVKAGFQALTVAPVDVLSQFLGTAAPTVLMGVGGAMAKIGATGIGAMQAGTGAAMGAGLAKGNIYEVVKEELVNSGISEEIAEDRAKKAQEYGGENMDQILLSTGLGGVAALGPLERIFARAPGIPTNVAAKSMAGRAIQGGLIEGTPEAAQAFQEQVAQNIALQREGFDVPTFRGAVANATLEGLAGFGIGAPIGMFSKPGAPTTPPAEEPEAGAPPLLPPPSPPSGPSGPEAPPGLPQLGGPTPNLPLLPGMVPAQFITGDLMQPRQEVPVVTGEPPIEDMDAAPETPPVVPPAPPAPAAVEPEIDALKNRLQKIQGARMDPTLSPNDPIFEELDAQENLIKQKITELSGPPGPETLPPPAIPKTEIPEIPAAPVTPIVAQAPPAAPVTPPAAPVIPSVTPVTPPVIESGRDKKEIQSELNRMRQSLKRTEDAVKKGKLPESDIPKLQQRIVSLEQELETAKPAKREVVFRNAEGKTWSGQGEYPPWLRSAISKGADLEQFRIHPEFGNRSEIEAGFDVERPVGFGEPVPPTLPSDEYLGIVKRIEDVKSGQGLKYALRGKLTPSEINDITGDPKTFAFMRAKGDTGRTVSDLVADGALDSFLPGGMRPGDMGYDEKVSADYIKELLTSNDPTDLLSEAAKQELKKLNFSLSEAEALLEPEDINEELQNLFAEERAALEEAEADVIAGEERGAVVPTGPPEFQLEGETIEQAKARIENQEKDLEAFERKRAADLERDVFALQPTPSAPPPTTRTGDLFGAAGMADQPARKPTVAAAPTPIEEAAEQVPIIDEESAKGTINTYATDMRVGSPSTSTVSYDDAKNELTYVETWKSNPTIPRNEFDELVSGAKRSDSATGSIYSILIEDTPTKSVVMTFKARSLKPTQKMVDVFMQVEEVTLEKPERTYEEDLEHRFKSKKLDDPDLSKKIQDARGIGKPVADAYVRAMKDEMTALVNWSYGKGTEEQFAKAVQEIRKIENRLASIEKRQEAKVKEPEAKKEKAKSAKTPSEFYQEMLPAAGFKRLDRDDSRTYKTKSGEPVLTFERDGVRVAVKSNTQLYADARGVGMYDAEGTDMLIYSLLVDEGARKQGKATKAMQDILGMADEAGMTTYVEPVQVTKDVGMSTAQLKDFYKRFGFEPQKTEPATDRVMIRKPGAKIEVKAPVILKPSEPIARAYKDASGFIYGKSWTNSINNQHRARLLSKLKAEGYTQEDAQDLIDRAVRIQANRQMPLDFLQLRDLQEAGRDLKLEEVPGKKEPEAKKTTGEPTMTAMQAELDRLKAAGYKAPEYIRDTAAEKEKKAAKAKKKAAQILKQATRSEIEYARFDDLDTDPIQGTPQQLKAAKEMADQVNGELVFYDEDLNLGLVTVANAFGYEDYFPIHGGIISKVDVADYTGLSTADKSFLNRIKRSISVFRESSGKMLSGTEDQQEGIQAVAKTLGGIPVYFDSETNVGLVRGYNNITGDPVYVMTMGDRYSTVDVEKSTVAAFAPYKAKLTAIKKELEERDAKIHETNPYIVFKDNIALSDNLDPKFAEIIREWKSMLGLGGVNIYFSTIEDAAANKDKFTGPHRVVGSGTLDANERGSARRMADGSYYVLFKKSTSKSAMLEVIAHEIGHVHEREAFNKAPQEIKNKLKEAYSKWLKERKGKTAREAVDMLRAKTTAQITKVGRQKAEELDSYWSLFSEWYADQVSRWAVTDEKPVSVVEKFFARLAAALRSFYQTLKGQRFLPDETFVQYLNQIKPTIVETIPGPIKDPVQLEMSFSMQKDLFGSTEEAKDIGEAMEPKGKKLPPGRSPELTAAAQAVKAGTMTKEQYDALVNTYKPIQSYAEPLRPATAEQVFDALDVKKREQINPQIPNGTPVGLRLDIPAFNRKGVFVVSIHQKRTKTAPGKVIGYGSVAKARNVTFGLGNELKALEIAAGGAKDALQTIEGEYVNITPEQAYAEAQRAIKDPSYVQVGIDPTRHAYFYDRNTTLPIVGAEEIIQIGNMVLAKRPVFGKKADFLYSIETGDVAGDTQSSDKEFLDRLFAEDKAKREVERQEKIAYYASVRRREVGVQKKIREYGSTLETQRLANDLNALARELKDDIRFDKEPVYTAENFLRQARAAVEGRTPYKDQALSPDVFAVIQALYMDDPKLLEGLRLSIKPEFKPEEELLRRAYGVRRTLGAFQPMTRIVNLYTGTKGVTDPMTIRHELTHSLEQMMTQPQREALINAYFDSLQAAIRKHKDAKSQEFFDALKDFLNKPSEASQAKMIKKLPSYDFYQYTSPSEYWAVNAEKLMASRLGTPWDRFKKSVRKMLEKLKDIFGFDNQFVVHDVFDNIMSGSKKRLTRVSLAYMVWASGEPLDLLRNIQDDADLISKYNRSDTPMLDTAPMKRLMTNAVQFAKDSYQEMVESPTNALAMMFNSLNRGVMYLRNKNIWFGSGLNETDRIKYNGQVRTAEGLATASLALDNMLRGGNIATQALFLGGVEYNPKTLTYTAVRKEKNMTKVYEAEAAIKNRIGDQLGTNVIQGYLEAKRSRSIKNEVIARKAPLDALTQELDLRKAELKALEANPKATADAKRKLNRIVKDLFRDVQDAKENFENIQKIAKDKVTMSDAEIDDFISREQAHPELKEIMDNFNAVNQNMLKFWREVGLLSAKRYENLASIKDYVPWYRIMNDEEDIHSPVQATTRSATNIGREKIFKSGKPSVINDFVIEENQDVFKIQPGRINMVKLNSKRLTDKDFTVTPQGEVRLKVPYKPGDVLVIQTQREIENMIDNMTRNVMRMTMNGLRQYAAQRIVSEYATRGADGKIMTFPSVDRERGRFDFVSDGRRVVVEIQDPLIAEAAFGMETVGMQMWKPLAAAANFTRRTITLSPVFQLKQVFKDAPTAALVTGVKNPAALMGGVFKGFVDAVRDSDPASTILRQAGIGGFYSPARTPEADVKRRIGIINNNTFDYVMKGLDHWGDSSDMAQRIATYNRVMAETGDEALAMYQSANVINFLRHGSGQLSQALVKTVPFLNAYAQSIDVLYNALIGGGLRGMDRKKALQRLAFTGSLLAGTTLLYAMLVGDDDDYMKLDDQTKVRSYIIPGTDVVLPMNTSAAFFFKAIPELIYNKVVNEGTENEIDEKRLRRALKESAMDMLLGPTPIPSAIKPAIEISLDRNFFTGRSITPRGMENLDAYQQYDMRTSEAAKILSGLTGTEATRLLNPMDADHLIRGIFGTAGGMVAWASNLIGQGSEYRPEMGLKEMPITGAFLRQEVPRGREDLFYTLKESTDRKYRTFNRLVERDNMAEAEAYLDRYPNLISYYDYTSETDTQLKEINAAVRYIGETQDPSYTPERKREEIRELLEIKNDILEGVELFRKEAYAE